MVTALLIATSMSPAWTGDFVVTVKGHGRAEGPKPNFGTWKIDREARGTIALTKSFRGAGIARTTDAKNESRYETWIAESRTSSKLRIHDVITVYGPLLAANQIRDDLFSYDTPMPGLGQGDAWQEGKVGSAILQFDYQEGKYLFESPRIYAKARSFFTRKFVKGPKKWTDTKPIVQEDIELEFEVIGGLNSDGWYQLGGKFKPEQREIVLTRTFPFTVPLGASVKAQKLDAQITLTLRKVD